MKRSHEELICHLHFYPQPGSDDQEPASFPSPDNPEPPLDDLDPPGPGETDFRRLRRQAAGNVRFSIEADVFLPEELGPTVRLTLQFTVRFKLFININDSGYNKCTFGGEKNWVKLLGNWHVFFCWEFIKVSGQFMFLFVPTKT